jgi:integrase
MDGKQYRRKTGTRSWAAAEQVKADLVAQLSGKQTAEQQSARSLESAIEVFLQDKKNQGVTTKVLGKYMRELARLKEFCVGRNVLIVTGLDKELLTAFASTWEAAYPASSTRSRVRERLSTFLRYCFEAEWLRRKPRLSPIKVEDSPTMPLTLEEYKHLLDTTYATFADEPGRGEKVRALLQLMRWSGLAIRDALTLKRSEFVYDEAKQLYRIVTSRQKTGTDVSVPIPLDVAEQLLAVLNGNTRYVFWSGNGEEESATKNMAKHMARLFDDAGIKGGHMRSHRLRDTFACELLQAGVPLEEVSKLLGHTSIKTTERAYGAWVKGRQDRLDALVTATWK